MNLLAADRSGECPLVRRFLLAWVLMLPLGFIGCQGGKPEGTVSGKVTYKGSPLTAGIVNFYSPDQGSASQTELDSSGAFKFPAGIPVGSYKVYVLPPTPKQLPPGTPPEKVQFDVPPKFQDANQTPVTKEVKEGPNDITIDLTE